VTTWIRHAARILDPGAGIDAAGDLWIGEDGRMGGLGPPPSPAPVRRVFDATGHLVVPMFVDLHVHFREPGGEIAETMASGGAAALAGGYAEVWAMPNTDPVCDTAARFRDVLARAHDARPVEVVPVAALSRGLAGRVLVDLDALAEAGAQAFSDDGAWLGDPDLADEAFAWAARHDRLVMQHCEDFAVTGPGVLHASDAVRRAGVPGIERRAEEQAARRDVALAERHGTRLHVCHVSTPGAVRAIRAARSRGAPVSGEVAPHHLVLDVTEALAGGADFKMKPPVREARDREALLEGLRDGTLQAIATDHAPHAPASKACGLAAAPFGVIGLETAFPVLYTHLVQAGRLSLETVVRALTAGPAAVVRRPAPTLAAGALARLNLVDVEAPRRVDHATLRSRSRNCPFEGQSLTGWVAASALGAGIVEHRPRA
jgi:dihydroorotase